MRRLVFALLGGLVLVPLPARAQGSVTFTVCNASAVVIDVFVSGTGTPIRPATCAAVAQAKGAAQPAYIGIAFTDARGQWGAARRFDGVPYMGDKVLSLATRTQTVPRGNASVTLPMQLLFQPRAPQCVSTGTTVPDAGKIYVGRTVCEELGYTLTVEAFPDSREISLGSLPVSGALTANGTFSGKSAVNWAAEAAGSKLRDAPEPITWTDLLPSLGRRRSRERLASGEQFRMPTYLKVRGTVSAVDVSGNRAALNFRESPVIAGATVSAPEFNVCMGERLDILQDVFGADYRTSLIGKVIEVQGRLDGSCGSLVGESLEILLARQIRQAPSVQFPAGTRVWVPPPARFTSEEKAALAAAEAAELQRRNEACARQAREVFDYVSNRALLDDYTKAHRDCVVLGIAPTAKPVPVAVAPRPVAPAPAVVLPAPVLAVTPTARAGALPIASISTQWVGRSVVATGTVARVEAIRGVHHVYFEGAGEKYVLCIRANMPGMQHPSELVGKTLEMSVRIDWTRGCLDQRVTIGATDLGQPRQLRVVDTAAPVK